MCQVGVFFCFLVGWLLAFGFVLNFILSIQATERNKQKKGKKKPANTLFNLNGVSDTERCGNCVLSCSLNALLHVFRKFLRTDIAREVVISEICILVEFGTTTYWKRGRSGAEYCSLLLLSAEKGASVSNLVPVWSNM